MAVSAPKRLHLLPATYQPFDQAAYLFFEQTQARIERLRQTSPELNLELKPLFERAVLFAEDLMTRGGPHLTPLERLQRGQPQFLIETALRPTRTVLSFWGGYDPVSRDLDRTEPSIATVMQDAVSGRISVHERNFEARTHAQWSRVTDVATPEDLTVALRQWFSQQGRYYAPLAQFPERKI